MNTGKDNASRDESTKTTTMTDGQRALGLSVVRLFNSHMAEVLDILSSRFPHRRGDKSLNEQEFQGLRAKVLRSGNNKIRSLPEVLNDFEIVQVFDTVITKHNVGQPVKIRGQE